MIFQAPSIHCSLEVCITKRDMFREKIFVNILLPISGATLRARMPQKRIRSAGSAKTAKGESLNACKC